MVGTGPTGLTGAYTLWVGLPSNFPAFPFEGLIPRSSWVPGSGSVSLPFLKLCGFLGGYHLPPQAGPLTARQARPIIYTRRGCRHC